MWRKMTDLQQLISETDKAFDNLRDSCPYNQFDECNNPLIDYK